MHAARAWQRTGQLVQGYRHVLDLLAWPTIRAEERLGRVAGGIFAGLGGGLGGGTIVPVVVGASAVAPALVPLGVAAWLGTLFVVSRVSYRSIARRRARRLQRIVNELAAIARSG